VYNTETLRMLPLAVASSGGALPRRRLHDGLVPPDDVPVVVIDRTAVPTRPVPDDAGHDGEEDAHSPDDHQDDTGRVEVEPVLSGFVVTAYSRTATTANAMMLAAEPPAI
jgi:hypothetical protein